jgi:hypothetical protein
MEDSVSVIVDIPYNRVKGYSRKYIIGYIANACNKHRTSWGVKGGRRVRLTTLPPSVTRLSRENVEPRRFTTLWAFTACYRDSFTFFLHKMWVHEAFLYWGSFFIFNSFLTTNPSSASASLKIYKCTQPDFVRYIRVHYSKGLFTSIKPRQLSFKSHPIHHQQPTIRWYIYIWYWKRCSKTWNPNTYIIIIHIAFHLSYAKQKWRPNLLLSSANTDLIFVRTDASTRSGTRNSTCLLPAIDTRLTTRIERFVRIRYFLKDSNFVTSFNLVEAGAFHFITM